MSQVASRILITGFGSFPGVPENASAAVVERLASAAAEFPNVRLIRHILPVDWLVAPGQVADLIAAERPEIILHFGVSRRAQGIVVESVAHNRCGSIVDICGRLPPSTKIAENAADTLASTFPAQAIVDRLQAKGLPAQLSQDAGGYLCNAVLYTSLNVCAGNRARTGFVHLPVDLSAGNDGLSLHDAVNGGLEIIQTCLEGHGG